MKNHNFFRSRPPVPCKLLIPSRLPVPCKLPVPSRLPVPCRLLILCLLLTLSVFTPALLLTGCALPTAMPSLTDPDPVASSPGSAQEEADLDGDNHAGNKLTIVCTAFPQYDWVRNLIRGAEDHVQVLLLNSQGTDMHSFQPTAENMVNMAKCDLFIHIGGFSETWVPAALEAAGNPDVKIITLLNHVDKKEESFAPGMVHDHDHNHDHAHSSHTDLDAAHSSNTDAAGGNALSPDAAPGGGQDAKVLNGGVLPSGNASGNVPDSHDEHEADIEYDEHLWLSLRCAKDSCSTIKDTLCQLDPAYGNLYSDNLTAYCQKLRDLDQRYAAALSGHEDTPLLFADRFPFLYLTSDYGLTYFAAFPGCSAETEASFETIVFLANEMKAHNLHGALILEGSKSDFARTILMAAGCTDGEILTINSMQSVTASQIRDGLTYLSIMEQNLTVLQKAL